MKTEQDRLIGDVRGYADLTAGHGMHVSVRGDQLRAVLTRIDTLQQTVDEHTNGNGQTPPEPSWQEPLATVIPIVADILEGDDYADLCGFNLVDALQAWAARNHTTLDPAAVTAVERALSGT